MSAYVWAISPYDLIRSLNLFVYPLSLCSPKEMLSESKHKHFVLYKHVDLQYRHHYTESKHISLAMKLLLVFTAILFVAAANEYYPRPTEKEVYPRPTEKEVYPHATEKGEDHGKGYHHRPIYCPKPVAPQNGEVKESYAQYKIGTIIHYSCEYGYVLVGSSWNRCVRKEWHAVWEYAVPICKAEYPTYP